jgi:hypothetical protein
MKRPIERMAIRRSAESRTFLTIDPPDVRLPA